ncbi:SDR family oxidoreductase [Variovorax sp. E3]|uniref:SDR family NAD(P)-dependent oxidoreductase n=1 Tax=Variovorax sp. E3 TaxID=1914993 RepID=UPI0027DABEEF|nr:SDR family oxidoreductase [Variovorax sp. E3]
MSTQAHPGTAVVTGASAGLGKIYADRLARRGHDLLLVARRGDRLEEVATALRAAYGVKVQTLVADLGAPADLERVAHAVAADPAITLLVNNAGTSTLAPVAQTSAAQLQSMLDVNIQALARLSHAVLPAFKARNRGTLVNVGSVLGFHTLPISSIYSGTKAFVLAFTRGLQDEVAGTDVKVQLVLPAATATDIWELSGVPVSNLAEGTVMAAEQCVDAALAGLDLGEAITMRRSTRRRCSPASPTPAPSCSPARSAANRPRATRPQPEPPLPARAVSPALKAATRRPFCIGNADSSRVIPHRSRRGLRFNSTVAQKKSPSMEARLIAARAAVRHAPHQHSGRPAPYGK